MKILVTGSKGMLANQVITDLKRGYTELGPIPEKFKKAKLLATDLEDLDISKKSEVMKYFEENRPDLVINCAAFTNVDGCETNFEAAYLANAVGPANLARGREMVGAKIAHISTDYVFDGEKHELRREYDVPFPVSAYGKTKLAGENFVRDFSSKYFIIRTAWLYGYKGKNFVKTMVRLCREKGGATVVNDQYGTPTNRADLSHHILKISAGEYYGIYHCTGNGNVCTWYEFAREIAKLAGFDGAIKPCTSEEYPSVTKRPEYSALDNMMLRLIGKDEMRDWKVALAEYFKNNQE
jgi:dTDP-4-dehydrorhamnose reductase